MWALALLYYLDRDNILPWVLASASLHEMGHIAAIRILGGQVAKFRLSLAGAELQLSSSKPLSPSGTVLSALAGPCVNLLLAIEAVPLAQRGLGEQFYFFAGLNLGLAGFNLLPIGWLDGGRALHSVLVCLGGDALGEAIIDITSRTVILLLLLVGTSLLWYSGGKNFTLLLAALWMGLAGRKRQNQVLPFDRESYKIGVSLKPRR